MTNAVAHAEEASQHYTIVFVDLVRFTSLTAVHGDLVGADAATALNAIASSSPGEAELVKTLGDGVLLRASSPARGVRAAVGILESLHELGVGIDARSGLHHGPVIERDGDIFGSAVNLAARITALASPGTLAATRTVALAATDAGLVAVPLGETVIRGFVDPVEVFEIDPCRHGGDWLTDLVCGMRIEAARSVGRANVGATLVGFCSKACQQLFADHPERYPA